MVTRITLFMTILIASASMALAQDNDPLVGTWTSTSTNGSKSIIRITKYGDSYLLKKKHVLSDGRTIYDNITVTNSSSNRIDYYDYVEEWDEGDNPTFNQLTCYYTFSFENGRGHNRYVRFEYVYKRHGGSIEKGGFDMPNTNNENTYYYKDDPDW